MIRFTPEEEHFVLCGIGENECYQEVSCYGDPTAARFWRMVSQFVNGDWTAEELKELSDSVAGQEILKMILGSMNYEMRLKLLQREVKELAKV